MDAPGWLLFGFASVISQSFYLKWSGLYRINIKKMWKFIVRSNWLNLLLHSKVFSLIQFNCLIILSNA